MPKTGKNDRLHKLEAKLDFQNHEIQELRSQIKKIIVILDALSAFKIAAFDNDMPSSLSARLESIERDLTALNAAKKQGKEDYLEIMKQACRDAHGMSSVPIPWNKIKDHAAFGQWFAKDIGRCIVNDCVGSKFPSSFCDEYPHVVDPASLIEFQ